MVAQASLALFDQRVHGPELAAGGAEATLEDLQRVWQQLQRDYSPWQLDDAARAAELQPFVRQMHLLSYGASYYCYLYCRVFSALVWSAHFAAAPLSPAAGAFVRRELFAPGGAADPVDILKRLAMVPPQQSLQSFVEEQLPLFLQHRPTDTAAAVDVALPADSGIAQQESAARAQLHAATRGPAD
jgi:Zn-dependent oligopeptidase